MATQAQTAALPPRILSRVAGSLNKVFKKVLWYVRQVSGDAAYDNYLRCKARRGELASAAISEKEFYLERIRREYSRISRCC